MMHQPNATIKYEPSSPASGTLASTGSRATTRAMSGADTANSEGEEMQASNPETRRRLQNVVLHRRKARGLKGIPSDLFQKPEASSLTQMDLDKREKRKEQNRKAATRCRAKKRELECKAKQETTQYAESNKNMQLLLVAMYQTLHAITTCLNKHLNCGDCKMPAQEQDQHRKILYETQKFLQSCPKLYTPDEQKRQQSSFAAENTDGDDASQVTIISNDNYISNSEMSCSTPTNDFTVTQNLDPNVSYPAESENLRSWDLQNINPDIPNTFSWDIHSFQAASDAKNTLDEFIQGISHNHSIQAPFQSSVPVAVSSSGPATTTESTRLGNNKPRDIHQLGEGSDFSLSRAANSIHSVSMYTEDIDVGILSNVVSPNLVQPSVQPVASCQNQHLSATIHRGIGSCNEGLSNGRLIGQQYQVNADINNNGTRQINATILRGESYSGYEYHQFVCNQVNYSDKSSSISPEIFTFGDVHSNTNNMEDSGADPISPFYTQGGSRRM